MAVSACSCSPLGRANTFSFLFLPLPPRLSLFVPPLSPYLLALAFPLFLPFLFFSILYPPKFYGQEVLVSSYILPYFLDYAIPSYVTLSQTALSAMAGNLVFRMFPTLYCKYNFLTSHLFQVGTFPSSALDAVSLVVRAHPTAVVFLSLLLSVLHFQLLLGNFATPSHACPAYSSFG